ncbi:MAG: sugar transferase [Patescibacteria group bacterium]
MKRADLIFTVLRLPVDFAMLVLAAVVAYFLRTELISIFRPVLFELNLPLTRYLGLSVLTSLAFLAAFAIVGLYSFKRLKTTEEFGKILVGCSAGILAVIIYIFLRQELFDSRFLVLGGWLLSIVFVSLGRTVVRGIQRVVVARRGFGIHKLIVIGKGEEAHKITHSIQENPALGYRVVGHLERPDIQELYNRFNDLGLDEVILADDGFPSGEVVALVDFCNEHHIVFKFVPSLYQSLTSRVELDAIADTPIIELKRTLLDGWGRVAKRTFDIVSSFWGLIILSPVFAILALAIKWETAGPVFARLRRVSKNKEFNMYKFRSMVENAEDLKQFLEQFNERKDGPLFKMANDPRVTRVGKFIRRWRIDELGQMINILKGDMSWVGPRPHQPDEIARYQKHHKRVLAIKAGASGLAQVSGSSNLPFEEEVALDTFYIENWSLWMDMKVILKTVLKMVSKDRSAV